jgi:hypothetical protein
MSDEVLTGEAPPPKASKMDVIRIVTPEPITLIIVSRAIYGQSIHWFGRRSHECLADRRACPGCKDSWPRKWKGYLHVTNPALSWQGFLEITQTAWELLEGLRPKQGNLRGLVCRIGRTKGGAKGRYLIEILDRRIEDSMLPLPRDPLDVLRMLWRSKKGPLPDC